MLNLFFSSTSNSIKTDAIKARAALKFLMIKSKNTTEAHAEMVKAYGTETSSLRMVQMLG